MKDTYNLLADGINVLARELAAGTSCSDPKEEWAREDGLGRYYFGSSLKGEAGIDWDDPEARRVFLQSVVADADRLLTVAREAMERFPAGDPERLVRSTGCVSTRLTASYRVRLKQIRLLQVQGLWLPVPSALATRPRATATRRLRAPGCARQLPRTSVGTAPRAARAYVRGSPEPSSI